MTHKHLLTKVLRLTKKYMAKRQSRTEMVKAMQEAHKHYSIYRIAKTVEGVLHTNAVYTIFRKDKK